jgi:CheY-like chemotaxis protein
MSLTSLVVCADAQAVQVLSRILREMGIRAEHCGDPHQAVARLKADRFDALVVDCENEIAVQNLITAAKSKNKKILTIAIVGLSNNTHQIFKDGADFVIYKPVSPERASTSLRAARALMPNEKRKKQRVPARGSVKLAIPNAENIPAALVDISEDGIAVSSGRTLPPQCKVYFEFKLPDQISIVRLSGDVMWTDFTGRVGLQFSRVPQASRQLLDTWLRENIFRQLESGAQPATPEDKTRSLMVDKFTLAGKPDSQPQADTSNRRVQLRQTCQFGAEIYARGSTVPHRCKLGDLSPGGCYVETPSPFSPGTLVELVVRTHELKATLKGKVRSAHVGYGMGVEFVARTPEEKEQISKLIALMPPPLVGDEVPVDEK